MHASACQLRDARGLVQKGRRAGVRAGWRMLKGGERAAAQRQDQRERACRVDSRMALVKPTGRHPFGTSQRFWGEQGPSTSCG